MDQNQQFTIGVNSAPPPRPLPAGHTCQLLEKFFTCHIWRVVEARDAAKPPPMHRTAPMMKNSQAHNVNRAKP